MWKIFKQAFMDTWDSFGLSIGTVLRGLFATAGTIFLFTLIGKEKAISEMMDYIIYAVAFISFAIIPTFLWNLWLAPYRLMEKHLENELNAIRNSTKFAPSNDIEEPQKVDVSDYQNHQNFLLYEAACLWVGIEPHHPIRDQKARAKLSQLKSDIRNGRLNCVWGNALTRISDALNGNQTRTPSDNQRVSIIALKRYAEAIGNTPSFLWNVSLPSEPPNDVNDPKSGSDESTTPPTPGK